MKKPIKIAFTIPLALQSIQTEFFRTFTAMMLPNNMQKLASLFEEPVSIMIITSSVFPIDVCRNVITNTAINAGNDYVFFFDADQTLQPQTPYHLLRALLDTPNADIMSAMYYKKSPGQEPVAAMFQTTDPKCTTAWTMNDRTPGIYPIELIGMGACVASKEAILKISKKGPWFKYQTNDPTKGYDISEDLFFCQQARNNNVKIFVDSGHIIGHLMTVKVEGTHIQEIYTEDGFPPNFKKQNLRPDIKKWPGA